MSELLDGYDAVFFDLDGVLYLGPEAVPGAVDGVSELHRRGVGVCYVTNNAARSTAVVADHLAELGFQASETEVISSAQAAAGLLRRTTDPGASVLVTGTQNLANLMTEAGLTVVTSADDAPDVVVQGYDPGMTWQRLDEASFAVQRGARWVATNTDMTRPTHRGIVPGAGTQIAAVRVATGVEPEIVGKPYRPLMEEAVRRSGAHRPLFVGDRIDTDIMGAHTMGIDSLMVFTGAHGVRDLCGAPEHGRPTCIGWNVLSLFEPRRVATLEENAIEGTTATCGSARVGVRAGVAEIEGLLDTRERQLDAAWALAQLSWAGLVSDLDAAASRLTLLP